MNPLTVMALKSALVMFHNYSSLSLSLFHRIEQIVTCILIGRLRSFCTSLMANIECLNQCLVATSSSHFIEQNSFVLSEIFNNNDQQCGPLNLLTIIVFYFPLILKLFHFSFLVLTATVQAKLIFKTEEND